jgi:hypothetical protein
MGRMIGWMALLAATTGGCPARVDVEPPVCEPATDQACDGGSGGGAQRSSKRFGDAARQAGWSIAVDGSGNIVLAGTFDGTVDFGGGPLTSAGGSRDVYVAKLDPQLGHLQSSRFGDASHQDGHHVAVDGAGNVLLTGYFQGSVDFGGGPLSNIGDHDVFVAKLDPQLGHLQSRRFGDEGLAAGKCIAADAAGDVIVAGYFASSIDFGGGPLTSAGGDDVFVAKLDPQLGHLRSRRFGDAANQLPVGVAVDADGNVVLTGIFEGLVDFGGGPLTSAGDIDVFVAKLDPQLDHLWSRSFGDAALQVGWSVAVDAAGDVVLAGYFEGSMDFGGGPLTSAGSVDAFVAKLDPQLEHLQSRRFGDPGVQYGFGAAVDGSGNVVLVGSFTDSVDFGGGPLTSADGYDLFVAKLDPQLEHLWSKRFGEEDTQQAFGVALDGTGNIALTGELWGSIDFGEGPLTSAGDADIFVAKLAP